MKKLVAVTLAAFAGSFLGLALFGLPLAVRAGVGQPATQNGDTNGDGDLDIADVVFTLVHLFRGGPAPVACADSPELVGRVEALEGAAAGTTEALHDVANALREFAAGPCREREDRFIDNRDGTVTDRCTGLIWQQRTGDLNGDGLVNNLDFGNWNQAVAYVDALELGGQSDWRMPSARELDGLMLKPAISSRQWPNAVDPKFGILPEWYWSSTPDQLIPGRVWAVLFSPGDSRYAIYDPGNAPHRVLALRGP